MFVIIKEKNSFFRAMNIFFISSKKVRVSPQKQNKVENIQGIFLASYFFFLYLKKPTNAISFFGKNTILKMYKKIVGGGSSTNFLAFFITPW